MNNNNQDELGSVSEILKGIAEGDALEAQLLNNIDRVNEFVELTKPVVMKAETIIQDIIIMNQRVLKQPAREEF